MSNADWFSRKLNVQPQQPAQPTPQVPLAQPMPATYQAPQQPQYPPTVQVTPQADRCPGCGSGNYGSIGSITGQNGTVSAMRCYDCGYPKVQSGTGVGRGIITPGAEGGGPARPARQVPTGKFTMKPSIGADGGFTR